MALPRVLQIRPTTSCPARCATCTTLVERDAPDLTLAEIEANLAHFTERHGVEELVFSGAEITTRPDFRELLEAVSRRRFRRVTLLSSGLAWTGELASACAGVIDRVVVALTPSTAQDWKSGLGRSARIRRSMRTLKEAGVRVQSNTVIQASSVAVLDDIATAIESLDLEEPIFLYPFATGGPGAVRAAAVPAWPDVASEVGRVLERLETRRPRVKNVPLCALGPLARFATKTTQRILVERGRQLKQHGLIPPFVGMEYAPDCSPCERQAQCDGYWPAHVAAGVMPAPRPLSACG